ncbi:acyl-CoA dehydrogenase [Nocardia sp. NPDC050718]|uniref:acyl-CoA dehydrogenase n=1 Tax=Nocardia sp. NPDC050718 TaxID=3155788 RepID=UPI0033D31796
MTHYKSNIRDLTFNLFEVLGLGELLDAGAFGDLDTDSVLDMLEQLRRVAEGPLGASFADADRNPPVFDPETNSVTLPESFKDSFQALREMGWERLGLPSDLGGIPLPRAVYWALSELVLGANPAAYIYALGPGSSAVFATGSDQQRAIVWTAVEQGWGGTMVLTEVDAGSDVGALRTKAIPQPDSTWHIEGVKRFISSADSDDLFDNILHLVLARAEGSGPGTKGLSLFFVPKYRFDPHTGELGERNGAFVTNVEHKMGLKVSATCELSFGTHGVAATGWLVGELDNGIAQMFHIIEHARMMVGTKAIATLSSGYLHALAYARSRVQGADLTRAADKSAPRVPIIAHPEVRRSLMLQKAYAEGLRAVYLYTAAHQDPALAQRISGVDPELAARVNDLLLPVVKGVGSERAYRYLAESLQTLGGSGYLQDYPIEQYLRDAKIDSIYAGTTAIQAQDFFFRKIVRDRGVAFTHLSQQIVAFGENTAGSAELKNERVLLTAALDDVHAITATLTAHVLAAGEDPHGLYTVGLASVRYLLAVGDLLIGWRLLEHAEIALGVLRDPAAGTDTEFYLGKVAVAQFFARNVLPDLHALRSVVSALDNDIMRVDEAVF